MYKAQVIPGISSDGHHALFIECDITPKRLKQITREVRLYKKANWEEMKKKIDIKCENFMMVNTVQTPINELWNTFKQNLEDVIQENVPTKTLRTKERSPWINDSLKKKIRKLKKLFKKQKGSSKQSRASEFYRSHRALVQKETRRAYWNYINNIVSDEEGNSKEFWRYIKCKRQESQGVAPLRSHGLLENDPKVKADILHAQFKSVFSPVSPLSLKNLCKQAINKNIPTMDAIIITENGVLKLLKKLNPNKAAGPDNIKSVVLKNLAENITPMITLLFNASLRQRKIPDDWKKANISPIYKKGEKYKAVNYRPVSLTCVLCKTLEHIVASQLMKFLNKHNLLYQQQHGFRAKLSTETQLLEFSDDMLKTKYNGHQSDIVIMDFSKVFDKVSHSGLLFKLSKLGASEEVCQWAKSFLVSRTQRVVVDGVASECEAVTSGVQASRFGPRSDFVPGLH